MSDYLAKLLAQYWELPEPNDVIGREISVTNDESIYISGIINTDYTNYINKFQREPDYTSQDNDISYTQVFMYKSTFEKYFPISMLVHFLGYGYHSSSSFMIDSFMGSSVTNLDIPLLTGRLPEKPGEIAVTTSFINKYLNENNDSDNLETYLDMIIPISYNGCIRWYTSNGDGYTGTREYTIVGILNDDETTKYKVVFTDTEYHDLLIKVGRYQIRGVAVLGNNDRENIKLLKELSKLNYRHNTNYSYELDNIRDLFNIVKLVLYGIGLVFTFFTILLIYTFISTNISIKQKDIGILTALGTTNKDIAKIFLTESLLIIILPCIIETVLTIFSMYKLNEYLVREYELNVVILYVNIFSLILTILLSVIIVFISTYKPIKKLTNLKPINVIKRL